MSDHRFIWTRDGKIPLHEPESVLGVGKGERIRNSLKEYVDSQSPAEREAMALVYERAYRRAGLLAGDPDEIDVRLPVASEQSHDGSQAAGGSNDPR